jgi:hypothetical protein
MKTLLKHQTKREELFKFLLLLAVLISYFFYLSWEYDLATGGIVSALTWSFFVLCTPVADAGFLIDFPVRLITGIRMFIVEVFVWTVAIILNLTTLYFIPESYDKTFLTSLFHKILTTPWPYWSIILLCGVGTFLSIRFGDEMMDVIALKDRTYHHKHVFKHKLIVMGALIIMIVWAYSYLIESLGVNIP